MPLIQRQVRERDVADHAGVVHHSIQPLEPNPALVDQPLDLLRAADVGTHDVVVTADRLEFTCQPVHHIAVGAVTDHEVGARPRRLANDLPTYSPSTAGDQDPLSV